MWMSKTQVLHQQARRILCNRSCLFRSYGTITAANQTLPSRIETVSDQKAHDIIPVLEQWRKQGHQVKLSYSNLRDSDQSSKALEASEWMCDQRVFNIFPEDYAARLHLTENVLGLEEAEKLFENIPENMRDYSVYTTLLSVYAKYAKTIDKAKATFEKMRKLGLLSKPSPFNSMISLYGQLRYDYMVVKLLREMKENKVEVDSVTVNNVLKVYASIGNTMEMEKYKTWVDEKGIKLEGDTIVAMAKSYLGNGSIEKAIKMYGDVEGSKREVYSLWNKYKNIKENAKDDGSRTMQISTLLKLDDLCRATISSLLKLDDVQGAEKIYEEWKPEGWKEDMRIPGLLISRFCAEENELKVKELVKSIRKKRNEMYLRNIAQGLITFGIVTIVLVIVLALTVASYCWQTYLFNKDPCYTCGFITSDKII